MDLPKDFTSFAKGVEMAAAVRKRAAEIENEAELLSSRSMPMYARAWTADDTPYVRPSPQLQAMMEIVPGWRDGTYTVTTNDDGVSIEFGREGGHAPISEIEDWIDAYVDLRDSEIGRSWQREMDRAKEMGFPVFHYRVRPQIGNSRVVVGDDAGAPGDRKFWNQYLGQPWRPEGEQS